MGKAKRKASTEAAAAALQVSSDSCPECKDADWRKPLSKQNKDVQKRTSEAMAEARKAKGLKDVAFETFLAAKQNLKQAETLSRTADELAVLPVEQRKALQRK